MCASYLQSSNVLNSVKLFHFTDELDIIELSCSSSDSLCSETEHHVCNENCLNVKIKEVLDPNFGMYVWPCAPVLGKYVWHNRKLVKDKVVLEIGAGTALASIVAAKCGANVKITDSLKCKSTLLISEENMYLNNISKDNFETVELMWGYFSPFLIGIGRVDIVLGSDVFYDPLDFEDIIVTVSYILQKNTDAEFWCAYEHRCSDWNIINLLEKWNLSCEEISLDCFGADGCNVASSGLPGLKTISLFVFRYKK